MTVRRRRRATRHRDRLIPVGDPTVNDLRRLQSEINKTIDTIISGERPPGQRPLVFAIFPRGPGGSSPPECRGGGSSRDGRVSVGRQTGPSGHPSDGSAVPSVGAAGPTRPDDRSATGSGARRSVVGSGQGLLTDSRPDRDGIGSSRGPTGGFTDGRPSQDVRLWRPVDEPGPSGRRHRRDVDGPVRPTGGNSTRLGTRGGLNRRPHTEGKDGK